MQADSLPFEPPGKPPPSTWMGVFVPSDRALLKLRFLMSHCRRNSGRDKVVGKKWISVERDIYRELPWRLSGRVCRPVQEMQETRVRYLGREDPLDLPTHSSILAWKIPRTVEPGGLQSMGSQSRTRLRY